MSQWGKPMCKKEEGNMYFKYKELFTPVKIAGCTIKNRFAMAPMGPLGLADAEGGFNQSFLCR